jgi:hypothetical protein
MLEYTRHAWQEDDACYNATLKICKDYEEGMLWYSEADQKKWRAYAKKRELDPNTDVHAKRRRMEQLWLRPLSRIPKQHYLSLTLEMAARHVVDGRRPRQKYYFDGAKSSASKKNTLVWVVDRIQRREAVHNALRWLTIQFGEHQPRSMA